MFSKFPAWLIPAVLFAARLGGDESNGWPLAVSEEQPDGSVVAAAYVGPLFFDQRMPGEPHRTGFRPFFLKSQTEGAEANYLFYPLFTWQEQAGHRSFSFFQLANESRQIEAGKPTVHSFDFWPFYFSRATGEPGTSYRALFPIGGTIKQRLGYDRIHFVLFPLYAEFEQKGAKITHAPWPILRFIDGAGHHGFEFWPFFGHRGRAHDYDSQFYLWPLIYQSSTNLSAPQPDVKLGVLPFYARSTAPGYIDETYVWPLFGYTHRTEPVKYDERRYLWPLLVQGRGDVSYINRWAPFYTHSVVKGYDKTWLAWPLFRHASWTDEKVSQEQNQVLLFLYWSLTQRSTTNPQAAPAHKTHLWPLFSSWDNGAGLRQFQLLSPFEVLFPNNEPIRRLYSPLFALYRYDQRAPDDIRQSVLFSLVSWKKSPAAKEFHLGPLFSVKSSGVARRITLGNGVLAWQRRADTRSWKFSLFDFHPEKDNKIPSVLLP